MGLKATAITDGLVQLTRFGIVNAYLVREDDGFTLVDTMISGSAAGIVDAASEAGSDIVRIVATHAHSDHVGSLAALADRLPDAELIASQREAKLMAGDRSPEPGEPEAKLKGGIKKLDLSFDRTVVDGEQISSLRVVAAPGHTPGQIALLDIRDQSLIAADSYSTLGGVATSAGPYLRFPLPGLATWHRPTALETARKLRALEPSLLAAGHGQVRRDPVRAMDEAIARST